MSSSSCKPSSLGSAAPSAFVHHASSPATKKHTSSLTLFRSLLGLHPDLMRMHKDQKAHFFPLHSLPFPWCLATLGFSGRQLVSTFSTPCICRILFFPLTHTFLFPWSLFYLPLPLHAHFTCFAVIQTHGYIQSHIPCVGVHICMKATTLLMLGPLFLPPASTDMSLPSNPIAFLEYT